MVLIMPNFAPIHNYDLDLFTVRASVRGSEGVVRSMDSHQGIFALQSHNYPGIFLHAQILVLLLLYLKHLSSLYLIILYTADCSDHPSHGSGQIVLCMLEVRCCGYVELLMTCTRFRSRR